jgi:hypothetical protein
MTQLRKYVVAHHEEKRNEITEGVLYVLYLYTMLNGRKTPIDMYIGSTAQAVNDAAKSTIARFQNRVSEANTDEKGGDEGVKLLRKKRKSQGEITLELFVLGYKTNDTANMSNDDAGELFLVDGMRAIVRYYEACLQQEFGNSKILRIGTWYTLDSSSHLKQVVHTIMLKEGIVVADAKMLHGVMEKFKVGMTAPLPTLQIEGNRIYATELNNCDVVEAWNLLRKETGGKSKFHVKIGESIEPEYYE